LIPAIQVLGVPADIADDAQPLHPRRAGPDVVELGLLGAQVRCRRRDLRQGGTQTADRLVDDFGVLLGQVLPLAVERQRFPLLGGQRGRVGGIGDDAQGVEIADSHAGVPSSLRYLTG